MNFSQIPSEYQSTLQIRDNLSLQSEMRQLLSRKSNRKMSAQEKSDQKQHRSFPEIDGSNDRASPLAPRLNTDGLVSIISRNKMKLLIPTTRSSTKRIPVKSTFHQLAPKVLQLSDTISELDLIMVSNNEGYRRRRNIYPRSRVLPELLLARRRTKTRVLIGDARTKPFTCLELFKISVPW